MERKLAEALRTRVLEFGKKPSYVLFPEELAEARTDSQFTIKKSENRGDGTIITTVLFEGNVFLCVSEKE